jgi:hypothetical protein
MPSKRSKRISSKRDAPRRQPYCFVSYSTREAHVQILLDCLGIVLSPHFEIKLTPSALASGASQHNQILSLVEDSAFAVVILDGLRPNVIYELGLIQGKRKPVLLFKEAESVVDIKGLYVNPPAELSVNQPPIDLNTQMSDVKDLNYARWERFDLKGTLKLVWQEYNKKRDVIQEFVQIEEPTICQ